MGKIIFRICVINAWICAGMLFICEIISKILPEMGEMLFYSLGGTYAQSYYQADFGNIEFICMIVLLINIATAVLLGISLYRKEKKYEKIN